MADLTFEPSTNQLRGFGRSWSARSGSSNMGGLKSGTYFAPANALMAGQPGLGVPDDPKYAAPAYTDQQGLSWFLWLGVGNLGIHPDGGAAGTLGCIGVTTPSTQSLFDELAKRAAMGVSVRVV